LILSTGEEQKARKEAENAHIQTDIANKELKIKNKEAENARIETEFANKELKVKNKELEQFVYVASHDLQEPLRTTSGFVKLIQEKYHGKLDEKADKYLDFISDASDRMRVLISDLMDFSRIGKKGSLEKIDCNTILKNTLADIMVAVKEAKADIQFTELPVIDGYPTEIKLLFQNLVINAIKFRKKDIIPVIRISAQKKEGFWEFAVSDNGIGIEQQHSERIFDIFQRLHTRKEYAGSGIGLAHCKKIVELHHGKILVESKRGEGSVFYFTIPEKNIA
jgi:two-component system, sensor histidine kinase